MPDFVGTALPARGPGLTAGDKTQIARASTLATRFGTQLATVDAVATIVDSASEVVGAMPQARAVLGAGIGIVLRQSVAGGALQELRVAVAGAGTVRLVLMRKTGAATYRIEDGVDLVAAIPNVQRVWSAEELIDFPPIPADYYLGIVTPAQGGAQIAYDDQAAGHVGIGNGSVPTTEQQWAEFPGRQWCAVAAVISASLVVGVDALSAPLAADHERSAVLANAVEISTESAGARVAWNAVHGAGVALIIGQVPEDGPLDWLEIDIGSPGTLQIVPRARQGSTTYTRINDGIALTVPVGAVRLDAVALAGLGTLEAGTWLEVVSPQFGGAGIRFSNATEGGNGIGMVGAPAQEQGYTIYPSSRWSAAFAVRRAAVEVQPQHLATPTRAALSRPAVTFEQAFGADAPASWTFGGAWQHSASGVLTPQGEGNMSQVAYLTEDSIFHDEQRTLRLLFSPQTGNANFFFGLRRRTKGCLVQVNWSEGQFGFVRGLNVETEWEERTAIPELLYPVALGAASVAAAYMLEIQKDRRINRARLVNLTSGQVVAEASNGTNAGAAEDTASGYAFGSPFIANIVGRTLIRRITNTSPRSRPRMMFVGDSITEVLSLPMPSRYAQILKDRLGGDAVIAGLSTGGATELTGVIARELPAIRPEWVLCFLGVNDTNAGFAFWRNRIDALVAWCRANGIRLALGTFFPVTANRQFDQLNAYLLTLANDVTLVRFDRALSLNRDGVTASPALLQGDGLHPNASGQRAMADQVLIDMPEPFDVAL